MLTATLITSDGVRRTSVVTQSTTDKYYSNTRHAELTITLLNFLLPRVAL